MRWTSQVCHDFPVADRGGGLFVMKHLSYTGSENMKLEGVTGLVVSVSVMPFERKRVAALVRSNPRAGCNWKYSYSLACVLHSPALSGSSLW